MELPVVLAAVVLALLVAGLARLVAVLDEIELALRRLVTGVRSVRRAVAGATDLATEVGQNVTGGVEALSSLERLKRTGRASSVRVPTGEGLGAVSLVIRPHPVPEVPPSGTPERPPKS